MIGTYWNPSGLKVGKNFETLCDGSFNHGFPLILNKALLNPYLAGGFNPFQKY